MGTITEPTPVMWDLVDAYEAEFPSAVFSGINGDAAHQTSPGKHLSWSQNSDKFGSNCWPLQAPNDKNAKAKDKAVAVDISMNRTDQNRCHNNFKKIYNNRDSDPRARYIYAFNGWDGEGDPWRYNVYTGANGRTDDSHKWHEHQEGFYAFVNDPEFVRASRSAFRGESIADYQEGDDLVTTQGEFNTLMDNWILSRTDSGATAAPIPDVRARIRAVPVLQYTGGGVPEGKSFLNMSRETYDKVMALDALSLTEEDLAAVTEAARLGAQAGAADVDAIADAVVERLNHLGLTDEQKTDVREVVSDVLLHGAATPPVPTE